MLRTILFFFFEIRIAGPVKTYESKLTIAQKVIFLIV